jgi:hypothetical protein
MSAFPVLTGEGKEQELRGTCMDTVGTFDVAVGVDTLPAYLPDLMKQMFAGIQIGSVLES